MATISVAILGLGRVGASVGLALKRYNAGKGAQHQFQIVGVDRRNELQQAAQKRGAVDSLAHGFSDAVRNKDIIVLALPYADVQAAYREFGGLARPGAVVLDMSPLKAPSLAWAQAALGEQVYMVGVTPVLNPRTLLKGIDEAEDASVDLFDDGAWLLVPSVRAAKDAVELAANLGTILGSTPHFMDPVEHDALIAGTEGLPALLGLAAFYTLQRTGVWGDTQRLTNAPFALLTHHLDDTHPDDLRDLLLNNRQSTVHYLDRLIETLQSFRGVIDRNDRDALEAALVSSAESYREWLARRRTGRWDEQPEVRAGGSFLSGMMGDYLARKVRGEKDGDDR